MSFEEKEKRMDEVRHPLERWNYQWCRDHADSFRSMGLTPNMVTFMALVVRMIGVWCLWNRYYVMFVVFMYAGMLLDSMDGTMARKFNMFSNFGDAFDHYSDLYVYIIIFAIMVCRLKHNVTLLILFAVLIFLISWLSIIMMGTCSLYKHNGHSSGVVSYNVAQKFCKCKTSEEGLKRQACYLQWFDAMPMNLMFFILIIIFSVCTEKSWKNTTLSL